MDNKGKSNFKWPSASIGGGWMQSLPSPDWEYMPSDSQLIPISDDVIARVLNSIQKDGTDVVHSSGEPKTDLNSD